MKFDVQGPYEIPRFKHARGSLLITKDSLAELKETIAGEDAPLLEACGCYVFVLKASKGYKPWYIGQAVKSKLLPEALNPSNITKYNSVIADYKGTPCLFLLPMLTAAGKLRRSTKNQEGKLRSVDFLEDWLIANALQKNPALLNQKQTHFLKNLHVVGLFNPAKGEATSSSSELKRSIF